MGIQKILIAISKRANRKLGVGIAVVVLLATGGMGLVSALPSNSQLVAHWSYDQSSGTTLTDNSGNGHTGTIAGTPVWGTGKINNGLTLKGSDNVNLGNITQINNVNQVTLATWMKRTTAGAKVLIGKQATNQDMAIEAYNDGKVYFQMSKGADTYGTIALNDTAWHHVALVFDGTQTGNANRLKAYVDGVQKTLTFKGTVGTTTTTNTTAFNIGKISGEYSNGQVDDTWLYARALSQTEVQDLMQPVVDTIAPSIPTNLTATAVSQNQIHLSWTASTDNVGVTGYQIYRNGLLQGTTTGTSYQDSGLSAGMTYVYSVRAYDAAGNQSADSLGASATTLTPPPAPTVGMTATPSTVIAGGSSTLGWTSTNATSCSASGSWSGAKATAGSQVINAIVATSTYTLTCDGAGGQAVTSVTVTSEPDTTIPTVAVTAPQEGGTVGGSILLTASAEDNSAINNVVFAVDGTQLGTDNSAPYEYQLNTVALSNGTHVIRATAYDASGNSAYSEVTITVENQAQPQDTTPPVIALSSPTAGATVSGSTTITADASDDTAVAGVKFYVNGTQIGNEVTAVPYSIAWDTATTANGSAELSAIVRDAAGNNTTSVPVAVTVNNVAQTTKFVSGISSNGRYFVDQVGAQILIKGDSPWALFSQLSAAQVEQWAANRESHGFNAAIVSLVGAPVNGGPAASGATYDGVQPFVGGNITTWNESYWARMDNYLTILKNHGITVFLYPMDGWNTLSGTAFYHKSAADSKTYGTMVATRYASYPNIVWMAGGDYNGYDSAVNTEFTNMLAGIRAAGNNKPFSTQLNNESLTTDVSTYEPIASWNFAYTYSTTYQKILKGYNRTPSSRDPRPVVFGEGNYEGEDNYGGPATTNETLRRQQLWALTSGAAGEFTGSQDWQFLSGWQNRLDTVWISQMQKIRSFFSGLDWHLLVPDDSTPLVTAGRGTKITADGYRDVLQNDYVTAAQTPDKSQTVVYVPTSVGSTNARTITLDLSRLPGSYTAAWVDPTDTSVSQPAAIDVSGQVTTPGLHSDGTRDWLLVIR